MGGRVGEEGRFPLPSVTTSSKLQAKMGERERGGRLGTTGRLSLLPGCYDARDFAPEAFETMSQKNPPHFKFSLSQEKHMEWSHQGYQT